MACTSVVLPEPSSPESPITAGAASPRPSSSPNRLSASADRRMGRRVSFGPELEDLVAQQRRQLEVELLGGRLHLTLEQLDQRVALLGVGRPRRGLLLGSAPAGVAQPGEDTEGAPRLQHWPRRVGLGPNVF